MSRGLVLPLTAAQRLTRMMYLAQRAKLAELDEYVRKAGAPQLCPDGYYRLNGKHDGLPAYNGGKDPTAPDPFDRWRRPSKDFENRTADCIGGMAWCGGFDRYQPERFAHIYDGWINTDSMTLDAVGESLCFERLERPELGCFVVCMSGSRGHAVGHIGGVVAVPAEWDPDVRECWKAISVVDVASRTPAKANQMTTALGWFDTGAIFARSKMQP